MCLDATPLFWLGLVVEFSYTRNEWLVTHLLRRLDCGPLGAKPFLVWTAANKFDLMATSLGRLYKRVGHDVSQLVSQRYSRSHAKCWREPASAGISAIRFGWAVSP